jgi:hypothetical protein
LILVDPGIDGSDLTSSPMTWTGSVPVVAGFCTHPHWDHLLWHPRFGDVPRYATPAGAHAASQARERAQSGGGERVGHPCRADRARHPAARGRRARAGRDRRASGARHRPRRGPPRGPWRPARRDMLSDVLIPLLDPRRPGQVGAFETALDRLGEAARRVDVLVPGHGAVAEGPEVAARLAADHAYIDALRRGQEPADARWVKTGSPASTSRTWSRPDPQPDELRRHRVMVATRSWPAQRSAAPRPGLARTPR